MWVDDVVLLRHPNDSKQSLVRRVAALEGEEMLSTDPEDKPFRIEPNSCWVLADNQEKKTPVSASCKRSVVVGPTLWPKNWQSGIGGS